MKFLGTIFLLFLFQECLIAQNRDISYMSSGGKLKPLQAIMDVRHYTLALDIDIPNQAINGYVEIELVLSQPTDTILFDLVHLLTVKNVLVENKRTGFYQQADYIFIVDAAGFEAGRHKIKIEYGGMPPQCYQISKAPLNLHGLHLPLTKISQHGFTI